MKQKLSSQRASWTPIYLLGGCFVLVASAIAVSLWDAGNSYKSGNVFFADMAYAHPLAIFYGLAALSALLLLYYTASLQRQQSRDCRKDETTLFFEQLLMASEHKDQARDLLLAVEGLLRKNNEHEDHGHVLLGFDTWDSLWFDVDRAKIVLCEASAEERAEETSVHWQQRGVHRGIEIHEFTTAQLLKAYRIARNPQRTLFKSQLRTYANTDELLKFADPVF